MDYLKKWINDFILYQEAVLGKSLNTIKAYKKDLLQFLEYLNNEKIISYKEIDLFQLRSYMAYLSKNDISKRSINRKISALRSFFSYLYSKNEIDNNYSKLIKSPKFETKKSSILSEEDFEKLRNIIKLEKIIDYRDIAIFELLYSSGIKSSELISLSEYHINFEEREMKIINEQGKERIVFFSKNARKYILEYIDLKKENYKNYSPNHLFVNSRGELITDRSLRRLVSNYGKKANLEIELSPHIFRNTFIQILLKNNFNLEQIQELLGIENISSIEN